MICMMRKGGPLTSGAILHIALTRAYPKVIVVHMRNLLTAVMHVVASVARAAVGQGRYNAWLCQG